MQDVPLRSLTDYRKAINSLNQSTNTVEAQTRATQRALSAISSRQAKIRDVAEWHSNLEQQRISTLIENLKCQLHDEKKLFSEKLRKKLSSTLITIADTLRRDDHILSQLESQTSPNDDNHDFDDERQEALLNALRYTLSEVIKARLKCIYLETSSVAHQNGPMNGHRDALAGYDTRSSSETQAEDVKADLRSLYAEIDDVAQMRVNHEHGDQLSVTMQQLENSRQDLSNLHTTQTLSQLKSMTDQLEQTAAHCEALQSQRIAQQKLEAHLESIAKAGQPRHQIPNLLSKNGIAKDDGPAIAALRQYLNLSKDGSASTQREEQAKQAFEEYIAHVQTSLELRNQQAGFLDRTGGGEAGSYVSKETICESRLTELDAHITKLKAKLEMLSG